MGEYIKDYEIMGEYIKDYIQNYSKKCIFAQICFGRHNFDLAIRKKSYDTNFSFIIIYHYHDNHKTEYYKWPIFAIISKEYIFWRSFYLIFYKCPFHPLIVIIDRYN